MLPEGWKSGKLADQLDQIIDYRGTSVPKAKSGIPLITARNVRRGFLDLNAPEYIDPNAEKEWMSRGYPCAGDVLFTTEAPLGNVAKFPENGKFCIGQRVVALRTKKHVLTSDFLLYQLLSDKGNDLINERSSGSTAKGIKTKELKKVIIPLPPLPEQKKIAAILSTWDQAIEVTEKLLANSQQQKKALMQQLLTGKKRLPGFTGEWKSAVLGEIANIETGSSNREDSSVDGLYAFFDRSEDIRTSSRYLFDCEAIIIPGEGQDFIPKYFHGKFDLHQRTYAIHGFDRNDGKFLYFTLSFHKSYLLSQAVGSTVKSLRLPMFKKMPVRLPALPEQKAIASVLTKADEEITLLKADLSRLRQEKKALMQQILTGKRRVKIEVDAG